MSYDDLSRPEGKHNEMIMNANAGESNPVSSFVKEAVVIIPLRRRFNCFQGGSRRAGNVLFLSNKHIHAWPP